MKRNRVMNNDVLKLIFNYLSLSEKVKLERSSYQFMICVNELLSQQKGLKIYNKNNLNLIMPSKSSRYIEIIKESDDILYLNFSEKIFELIFEKCFNITSLELIYCDITEEIITFIGKKCTKIKTLKLYTNVIMNEKFCETISEAFGKSLIRFHIQAKQISQYFLENISQKMSLIEDLSINSEEINSSSNQTFNSLLRLRKFSLISNQSNERIISLLPHLKNITHLHLHFIKIYTRIGDYFETPVADNVLLSICDNLIHLKSLSITNVKFSSILCINKLKYLENVEIICSDVQELCEIDFKYLRSLTLYSTAFTPITFEIFVNKFLQLSKLCLFDAKFKCECHKSDSHSNDCECYEKFVKLAVQIDLVCVKVNLRCDRFVYDIKLINTIENLKNAYIFNTDMYIPKGLTNQLLKPPNLQHINSEYTIMDDPEHTVTTLKNFNSILVNKPKTLLTFENVGLHLNNLNLDIQTSKHSFSAIDVASCEDMLNSVNLWNKFGPPSYGPNPATTTKAN